MLIDSTRLESFPFLLNPSVQVSLGARWPAFLASGEGGTEQRRMGPFPVSAFQKPKLNKHEFELAPGEVEGQGSLQCCSPWGHERSDTTEWLNHKTLQGLRRGRQTNQPKIKKQSHALGRSWRPHVCCMCSPGWPPHLERPCRWEPRPPLQTAWAPLEPAADKLLTLPISRTPPALHALTQTQSLCSVPQMQSPRKLTPATAFKCPR